jgi:hypothetical protein
MAEDKEAFLSRWSRLKRENRENRDSESKEEAPAPVVPPVETLTPESDFKGFMHPKVEDALRRVALKKLFSDPHFNTPDPFEPYSVDFTKAETISEEMLAQLNQARTLLFDEKEKAPKPPVADAGDAAQEPSEPESDESRRKDA